jgi:hypothetical protein
LQIGNDAAAEADGADRQELQEDGREADLLLGSYASTPEITAILAPFEEPDALWFLSLPKEPVARFMDSQAFDACASEGMRKQRVRLGMRCFCVARRAAP